MLPRPVDGGQDLLVDEAEVLQHQLGQRHDVEPAGLAEPLLHAPAEHLAARDHGGGHSAVRSDRDGPATIDKENPAPVRLGPLVVGREVEAVVRGFIGP
ncbi:hypothetical protein ACWD0A_29225 [Streptomyces sp. NPDC002867]